VIDPVGLAPVLNRVAQLGQECIGSWTGFFLEHRKTGVAIHYRLAEPSAALQVLAEFSAAVRKLLKENDLELLAGKRVLEIRPRSVDKGQAVKRLMGLHPQHYPIYIGDDLTDEDSFKVIRNRGTGVLVSKVDKRTLACLRLGEPKEVVKLLQIISTRCEH
jgi:trehalose 6-phosphate phosphatase